MGGECGSRGRIVRMQGDGMFLFSGSCCHNVWKSLFSVTATLLFLFIWKRILNKCERKPLSEGLVEGVDKAKGGEKLRGILRKTP